MLWSIIVGGVIGLIAGSITKRRVNGCYCKRCCRFSWFCCRSVTFRNFGVLVWAGMALLPSLIIGAVIV